MYGDFGACDWICCDCGKRYGAVVDHGKGVGTATKADDYCLYKFFYKNLRCYAFDVMRLTSFSPCSHHVPRY